MTGAEIVGVIVRFAATATGLAVALAVLTPDARPTVRADLFVVLLGGWALLEALRWLRRTLPTDLPLAPRLFHIRRPSTTTAAAPPALRQLELLVASSATDGRTAAARLRPRLAALAAARRDPATRPAAAAPALDRVLAGDGTQAVPVDELAAALEELSA